jgi:ADP-ribose pyrophosphatase
MSSKQSNGSDIGRISSQRVYSGKVVSLDVDNVRFPNGVVGELEMVRHPGASAVVPISGDESSSDPDIVLIRQYRYAAEGFLYEIPAGRLHREESPEDCARRELREETGYTAERLERLTTIYTTPGFTDERIHLFVASVLTKGESSVEADEILDLETVQLSGAVDMIRGGQVVDAKTIVALLLAALRLNLR